MNTCKGINCNSVNGCSHSKECNEEHEMTVMKNMEANECFEARIDNRNGNKFKICMHHNSCRNFGNFCTKK